MGEEKCTPREKILGMRMRKGPRLTLVWGPRIVNPALLRNTSSFKFWLTGFLLLWSRASWHTSPCRAHRTFDFLRHTNNLTHSLSISVCHLCLCTASENF